MDSLVNDYLTLLAPHEPPCLSLYQPTSRRLPEKQQDPIRFRNLVKTLEESLRQRYAAREIEPLLEPFRALAVEHNFWKNTLDGLAVLAARGIFRIYRLQRPVVELAVVADTFHIKPLMRILQSADRYQVLGLNRQEVKLFEGNRDALDEIDLAPGVPRTINEALGDELTEPYVSDSSYRSGPGGPHHGQGSKKDEVDLDTERFFRAVDRAVMKHHSKPSGLPLLLAALPEYHAVFRKISHNPFLVAEGIDIHPDSLSLEALRERAWSSLAPQYHARLAGLIEQYGQAKAKGLGADELEEVAEAAVAGRVATLLIEASRNVPGRLDAGTGRIEFDDIANPQVDDLLDDLAELVLKKGGQIVIVPTERMPVRTGIAAIYRF